LRSSKGNLSSIHNEKGKIKRKKIQQIFKDKNSLLLSLLSDTRKRPKSNDFSSVKVYRIENGKLKAQIQNRAENIWT